ncbi:hypothetical protein M0Q50_04775 [bacterium]|jgi:hypothetical protein|nr:hypothetical protein [bacterium]
MEILFKENVVFDIVETENELKEKILNFILESKTNKILFKGDPLDINYKLLKKILPLDEVKFDKDSNSIDKFIILNKEKGVRETYNEFLDKVDCNYCLIYKK